LTAINEEYGSINTFAHVLAENFSSNNGEFKEELLTENAAGKAFGGLFSKLFGLGARKLSGKLTGHIVGRFGKSALGDAAKFVGKKSIKDLTTKDMGRYISRNLVKNANTKGASAIEKEATWLVKNTNMSAQQAEMFIKKYSTCPPGCDPKLWKKAWKEEAKGFHGGVQMNNKLVMARYNALAKASGVAASGAAGSTGGTVTNSMLAKAGKFFGKTWKIIKYGGLFFLITAAGKFLWDNGKQIWEKYNGLTHSSGEGGNGNGGYADVYSKAYGRAYLDVNPDDYRL
jgi:hypothetical protein